MPHTGIARQFTASRTSAGSIMLDACPKCTRKGPSGTLRVMPPAGGSTYTPVVDCAWCADYVPYPIPISIGGNFGNYPPPMYGPPPAPTPPLHGAFVMRPDGTKEVIPHKPLTTWSDEPACRCSTRDLVAGHAPKCAWLAWKKGAKP